MDFRLVKMANSAVRFVLELIALLGIALGAWSTQEGLWRPMAALIALIVAIYLWGTFNVGGDPSRSGEAPVEVPGVFRFGLEILILLAGAIGFVMAGRWLVAVCFVVAGGIHYLVDRPRVEWLINGKDPG